MTAKKSTQNERLAQYLIAGNSVNPLKSWQRLGIYRLASRIHDLRSGAYDGISYKIQGTWLTVKNQFGEDVKVMNYWMKPFDRTAAYNSRNRSAQ